MIRSRADLWMSVFFRSVAFLVLGVMLCLPAGQSRADWSNLLQTRYSISSTVISTTFLPLAIKLASPNDAPSPGPLFARVLAFDGLNDHALAPDQASLDLGRGEEKDFTIEAFFYVPANSSGLVTLLHRDQFTIRLLLTSGTSDGIHFEIHFEKGNLSLFPVLDLVTGWHHLAVSFDDDATPGRDVTGIYLDGSLEATHNDPDWGLVLDSSNPLYLGSPSGSSFGGWIEEVRLSSMVRYTTSVYTVPDQNFEDDDFTRALWHFDEPLGFTSFVDYSGNGNRLVGVNGAINVEP